MENPPDSWYRPEPPTDAQILGTWAELFPKVADKAKQWLLPNSPPVQFINKCIVSDLFASITTATELQESQQANGAEDSIEIPSFTKTPEEQDDETDWQSEPEEGDLALIDSDIDMDERSTLLLHMEIRRMRRRVVTAGIIHHRYDAIIIPHSLGLQAARSLSKENRQHFADILLYQVAQNAFEHHADDEDKWMTLQSIIDTYLDFPTMRAFHKMITED